MTTRLRSASGILVAVVLAAASGETARGYATLGSTWANGSITMHLQLAGSGGLSDGSASFNAAATDALNIWNQHLTLARFAAVQNSTVNRGDGDLVNNVFFDNQYYGESFPTDTLAITTRWEIDRTRRVEADVVFNTAFQWDAYRGRVRGNKVWDLRRVALHEFGHALGLDHPDDRGQRVHALMNSILGDLDSLTDDDIAGGRALYGAGITSNISFPPRNETNDFFRQLIGVYRDELRAAPSTTYLDDEGKVVWIAEYTYYRVGQCDHPTAQSRVFEQVVNQIAYGVCALTPIGPIPFPGRGDGLQFMLAIDDLYRTTLGRSALTSFVNAEGAVVWVMEYLRYRLNGCHHGDASSRVLQQIRGQGIQPVCSA